MKEEDKKNDELEYQKLAAATTRLDLESEKNSKVMYVLQDQQPCTVPNCDMEEVFFVHQA